MLDATQIVVAGTGAINIAPEGTALPTDESTALNAAFKEQGYATEDGVTFTNARNTDDLMGWQSSEALRILTTSVTKTLAFTLMQFVPDNLIEAFSGGTKTITATKGSYTFPATVQPQVRAVVIDWADGTAKYRGVFARAQIQGEVQMQLQRSNGVLLPMEFRVLASATPAVFYGTGPGWIT